jgi:hypothetical protein
VNEEIGPTLLLLMMSEANDAEREFLRHLLITHEDAHPPTEEQMEARRELERDMRRHQRHLRAAERERQKRAAALLAAGNGPAR